MAESTVTTAGSEQRKKIKDDRSPWSPKRRNKKSNRKNNKNNKKNDKRQVVRNARRAAAFNEDELLDEAGQNQLLGLGKPRPLPTPAPQLKPFVSVGVCNIQTKKQKQKQKEITQKQKSKVNHRNFCHPFVGESTWKPHVTQFQIRKAFCLLDYSLPLRFPQCPYVDYL